MFLDFWPNPGPGRLPVDSGRGDVELAGVFASVASLAVSFVPESIRWNLAEKKVKKWLQARPGNASHYQLFVGCINAST